MICIMEAQIATTIRIFVRSTIGELMAVLNAIDKWILLGTVSFSPSIVLALRLLAHDFFE